MALISLSNAESLISLICLFFAYCFSVTLSGAGQAYIAHRMGDDTALDEGYVSLNPIVHIDIIGALSLLLFHFGWGRQIPINPFYIKKSWHTVRMVITYASEALISMGIAFLALISLVLFFKMQAFYLAIEMFSSGSTPTRSFLTEFPEASSLTVICALLLVSIIFFNVFIATYSVVINGVKYWVARSQFKEVSYDTQYELLLMLATMVFLFIFAHPLRVIIMNCITLAAYALGYWFNLL